MNYCRQRAGGLLHVLLHHGWGPAKRLCTTLAPGQRGDKPKHSAFELGFICPSHPAIAHCGGSDNVQSACSIDTGHPGIADFKTQKWKLGVIWILIFTSFLDYTVRNETKHISVINVQNSIFLYPVTLFKDTPVSKIHLCRWAGGWNLSAAWSKRSL